MLAARARSRLVWRRRRVSDNEADARFREHADDACAPAARNHDSIRRVENRTVFPDTVASACGM